MLDIASSASSSAGTLRSCTTHCQSHAIGNSNFTLTFIVNPGMLVITPVPVIATSTRTRRTYSSHRPTDRECGHSSSEMCVASAFSTRSTRSVARGVDISFLIQGDGRLALMLSVFVEHFIEHRILAPTSAFSDFITTDLEQSRESHPQFFVTPRVDSRRSALFRQLCDQAVSASRRRESRRPNAPRNVQFSSADRSPARGKKRLGFTGTQCVSNKQLLFEDCTLFELTERLRFVASSTTTRRRCRLSISKSSSPPTLNLRRARLPKATAYCAARRCLRNRRKSLRRDCRSPTASALYKRCACAVR